MDTIQCDICSKEKPKDQVQLMMEGAGLSRSKNARVIEHKIRQWAEFRTNRKLDFFPFICFECQRDEYFRELRRGRG